MKIEDRVRSTLAARAAAVRDEQKAQVLPVPTNDVAPARQGPGAWTWRRAATLAMAFAVFLAAGAFVWAGFHGGADSVPRSSDDTPAGEAAPSLLTYVNPMGVQIAVDYPSDWQPQSVSQESDPAVTSAGQIGLVVSNASQAMPSPGAATPSPGPLPSDPQLPSDYVTVTILTLDAVLHGPLSPSALPLSMSDAKVVPGDGNIRILEATVSGRPLTISVQAGPDASSSDLALADAIVASIRPSEPNATRDVPSALHTTSFDVEAQPYSLVSGGGFVWVGVYDGMKETGAIDKIDPASGALLGSISLAGRPTWMSSSDGLVWVSVFEGSGASELVGIDADSGQIVRTIPGLAGPILAQSQGVWAIGQDRQTETNALVLIDPTSTQTLRRIDLSGSPIDMAATADSIWLVLLSDPNNGSSTSLVRVADDGSADVVTPIDVRASGIWIATDEANVWLSAWHADLDTTSTIVSAQDGVARSFGSVYNFRPFTVAEGRVWFVAGPGDGPLQGVCAMRLDTQQVDECADVAVGDLEIVREELAYEPSTNTLWVAGDGKLVHRVDL
jgi:hypothetical protein